MSETLRRGSALLLAEAAAWLAWAVVAFTEVLVWKRDPMPTSVWRLPSGS